MLDRNQFSCFLIGEGTLPIQCAELLLEQEHQILGIISPDGLIGDWASEKGISHIQPTDNLLNLISRQPFDYLFSIVNNFVLPNEILDLPRQYAINFHDAPLPKYAGVNSTSWALMQQEKTHGITWHKMSEVINGGDILKQVSLEIAEGETALTLNGKCYEAAIHSFAQLIDELSAGKAVAIPQNLDQRTYFPPFKRPSVFGLLSFNRCAYELHALVRALNFGQYPNTLGLAKLAVGSDFIIVSKLDVLDELSPSSPGTITDIGPDFLKISTNSYEIALRELQTLEGKPLSIPDLVKRLGLQVGYRFQDIDLELAKRIEQFDSLIAKHEAFWVERLASLQPLAIPYAEKSLSPSKQKRYASVKMPVLDEVITFLEERHPTWNSGDFLLAAFVGYLARIGGAACFDIGYKDVELGREIVGTAGFFADYVPCRLTIDFEQNFEAVFESVQEQIALTKQHKSYARDAVVRYPELRSVPELGSEQIFPVVIERVEKLDDHQTSPGNELTFIISEDRKECSWFYNAEILDGDSIARMVEQFTIFLQGIVTDSSQHLAYLPLLSEEERHKILVEWNDTKADYPLDKCIHKLFEEQVEQTPDHVAVRTNLLTDGTLTCSYQEIPHIFDKIQRYLREQGIGKEDCLALECENSLSSALFLLYLLEEEYSFLLLPKLVNMSQDGKQPIPRFCRYRVETGNLTGNESTVDLKHPEQFLHLVEHEGWIGDRHQANHASPKLYLRTSGSTGKPKIAVHSHAKLMGNALNCVNRLGIESEDRIAIPVPIFHMYGLGAAFLPGVAVKASIDLQKGANLLRYLQREKEFVPNVTFMTPAFCETLLKSRKSPRAYKLTVAAGDRLKEDTFTLYESRMGCLVKLYGSTEMGAIAAASPQEPNEVRSQTVGKPMSGVQLNVREDQEESLEGMEDGGELWCQHEYGFEGYVDDNGNSVVQDNQDDWFRTKDLGRIWADGHLEVLGRCDHSVNRDGLLVFFSDVEKAIESIEGIESVVVVSKGESQRGKGLVAYCVVAQAAGMTEADIRSACFERLLRRAVPDRIWIVKSLPTLPNGKVDRQKLLGMDDDEVNSSKSI